MAAGLPVVTNPVGVHRGVGPPRRDRVPGDDRGRVGRGRPDPGARPGPAAADGRGGPPASSRSGTAWRPGPRCGSNLIDGPDGRAGDRMTSAGHGRHRRRRAGRSPPRAANSSPTLICDLRSTSRGGPGDGRQARRAPDRLPRRAADGDVLLEALPAERPAGLVAGLPPRAEGEARVRPARELASRGIADGRTARLGPIGRLLAAGAAISSPGPSTGPSRSTTTCSMHPPQSPADRRRLDGRAGGVHRQAARRRRHPPGPAPGQLAGPRRAGDGLQFFLIDVHDVGSARRSIAAARRANLVLFNRWFQLRAIADRPAAVLAGVRRADASPEDDRRHRARDRAVDPRPLGIARRAMPAARTGTFRR